MILLRSGARLASQVGSHAIFIRERIHKAASRGPGIYLKGGKKNYNNINKSHPIVEARQASQLSRAARGGFGGNLSAGSQNVSRGDVLAPLMSSGPQRGRMPAQGRGGEHWLQREQLESYHRYCCWAVCEKMHMRFMITFLGSSFSSSFYWIDNKIQVSSVSI